MTKKELDELIDITVRTLAHGVNAGENSERLEKYFAVKEQLINKLVKLGFVTDV